jgi:hypothetical protein
MRTNLLWMLLPGLLLATPALGGDTVPSAGQEAAAEGQKKQKKKEPGEKEQPAGPEDDGTIIIRGQRMLKDAELVGSYRQPMWTTARRFPSTRVYVLPAGNTTFEYWLITEGELESGNRAKFRSNYELELGLGAHLQLDLYLFTEQAEGYAPLDLAGEQIELRWAFADWGVIWGNPALYLEWVRRDEKPQKLEAKLLLGDLITPRLFWGLNLVYERELGGESEGEYALSFGLAYTLVDGILSLGLEGKVELVDVSGARFDFAKKELLFGPSLQIRPLPGVHLDLVPMFGVEIGEETEAVYAVYFIVGKEFSLW